MSDENELIDLPASDVPEESETEQYLSYQNWGGIHLTINATTVNITEVKVMSGQPQPPPKPPGT